MKKTLLFVAVALAFTACSQKSNISLTPAQPKAEVYGFETVPTATFTAFGDGVPPLDTYSPAQARALAKRAAIADAQRQIATKLFGVKINAKDTVKDAMLKSSVIEARVHGLVKNAAIVDEQYKDGLYRVELEVQMDKATWERLFAY
ncbi:hypothetical protein [Campylobacter sp.]|uniref:LPP20 family lipoprotein n=1 Tax=Campylobacter sp. TaxID=205 RepID=UPI002A7530F2|nr:hypothetical protein [Campylobacter sp.]MDY3246704.1 hypothetical protein [Campylobacter sp.]